MRIPRGMLQRDTLSCFYTRKIRSSNLAFLRAKYFKARNFETEGFNFRLVGEKTFEPPELQKFLIGGNSLRASKKFKKQQGNNSNSLFAQCRTGTLPLFHSIIHCVNNRLCQPLYQVRRRGHQSLLLMRIQMSTLKVRSTNKFFYFVEEPNVFRCPPPL